MSEQPVQPQSSPTGPTADFGDAVATTVHCSRHACVAGHEWSPKLAIVQCPGCNEQMLAMLMSNCPICNEPVAKTFIRTDHLPHGGAITPICKGSESLAESTLVVLTHTHAADEAERYKHREVLSKT